MNIYIQREIGRKYEQRYKKEEDINKYIILKKNIFYDYFYQYFIYMYTLF